MCEFKLSLTVGDDESHVVIDIGVEILPFSKVHDIALASYRITTSNLHILKVHFVIVCNLLEGQLSASLA